jgi:hypothetical protein
MAGEQAETQPRLVVPAYFHPALHPDQWEWLADHAPQVRLVILNVASGPGTAPEPVFRPVLDRLGKAGVPVAGYVDTNYGHRPAQDALTELGRYLDWYEVGGVCFDRVAAGGQQLRYYAALSARAREMGAGAVLFNHGMHPVEEYAEHADVLGTFEGPWPAYLRLAVPHWTRSRPAEMFYHVVYSVPTGHFGDAFALAVRRRAASVYVTDRDGANPYDQLLNSEKPLTPWMDR